MKIDVGIACSKVQMFEWWSRVMPELMRVAFERKIEWGEFLAVGSAMTDYNRNDIVTKHLAHTSDAIMWLDDDTVPQPATLERLLMVDAPVVLGVYHRRGPPFDPLAYKRMPSRLYTPLKSYQIGEIVPVDSVGMGCTLVRREVYEEIQRQYRLFRRVENATIIAMHEDDVVDARAAVERYNPTPAGGGRPFWEPALDFAGKVVVGPGGRGYLVDPLVEVTLEESGQTWPHYVFEWGRTEDHFFCEHARRCGFDIVVDTWLGCEHLGVEKITWRHFWKMREKYAAHVALQEVLDPH